MDKNELLKLESTALKIRRNILRLIKAGEAGHVGGALSSVEILTALYFNVLNVDPLNPKWPLRWCRNKYRSSRTWPFNSRRNGIGSSYGQVTRKSICPYGRWGTR